MVCARNRGILIKQIVFAVAFPNFELFRCVYQVVADFPMEHNQDFTLPRDFCQKLNRLGRSRVPFVFVIDYKCRRPEVWLADEVNPEEISYNFNGFSNEAASAGEGLPDFHFVKHPVPFSDYAEKFDYVRRNILEGNSFLVNLSQPTPVTTNLSLRDIFRFSKAHYRFLMKDRFVCFSPEIFIRITGHRISSYPMKGTIDASIAGAADLLLADEKERAEHATIVDLIRNDLSRVARKVWVERYRYLDRVTTNERCLLQMSSEIAGILPDNYGREFGDILEKLLPAGSVTGAPKPKTLGIIGKAEGYDRGYYTGIMGYFDGHHFETSVMIRYIESRQGGLVFKSGGGITCSSRAESEYKELVDKVYLPFEVAFPS